MKRFSIVLCGIALMSLSICTLCNQKTTEYSGPFTVGLCGLALLVHQLTTLPTRLIGELVGARRDEEIIILKVADSLTLELNVALENRNWTQMMGRQVIVEVVNSWIIPPTVHKIQLNTKVED